MFLWHHQTCAKKTALFHMTPKRGTVKPITWCCSTRAPGDFVTLWLIVNTKPRINVPNISRTWTPCNMHGVGVMESRGHQEYQIGKSLYRNIEIRNTKIWPYHPRLADTVNILTWQMGLFCRVSVLYAWNLTHCSPEISQGVKNPCHPLMWFGYTGTKSLAGAKSACSLLGSQLLCFIVEKGNNRGN